jgi:Protein of unknown function (DUF3551)
MKIIFVIFTILDASVGTGRAQNAPWCLQSYAFDGGQACAYATFQQCLVDRQFFNGFCTQNSTYGPISSRRRRR